MTAVSIRLPEQLLHDVDISAQVLHLQRAEYIRQALQHMNEETLKHVRKQQLERASLRVRKESMRINKELSDLNDDRII